MAQRIKQTKTETKPKYKYFLSLEDFNERKRVWIEYYSKVKDTKAYKRFIKQKEAMQRGDIKLVKEYAVKAKEQRTKEEWELKQPSYPDPILDRRNGKLGIYEWDGNPSSYDTAKEMF